MMLGQESINRSHLNKRQSYNPGDHVQPKEVAFVISLQDDLSVDFLWQKLLKKVSDSTQQLTWSTGRKNQQHEDCFWMTPRGVISYGMWHEESQTGKFDLICSHLDLIFNHYHPASQLFTPLPTKCSLVSPISNFHPILPTLPWDQLKQKTFSHASWTLSTRLSSGSKVNLTGQTHQRSLKEKFCWGKWWWVVLNNHWCLSVLTQCRNFISSLEKYSAGENHSAHPCDCSDSTRSAHVIRRIIWFEYYCWAWGKRHIWRLSWGMGQTRNWGANHDH